MANTIDLFIQDTKEENLIETLKHIFKTEIITTKENWGYRYSLYTLDIMITLFENTDLEDDMNIVFSEFKHQISFIKMNKGLISKYYDKMYQDIIFYLSDQISFSLKTNCMVVENLSKILYCSENKNH